MNAGQLIYGISANLEHINFLIIALLESIREDDGATWAAVNNFRAVMTEAYDRWARVIGEA